MTIVALEAFQNLGEKIDRICELTGTDIIDAVISYCEKHNLEIETIGEIISKNAHLRSKVELEAEGLHYLKKTDRLPV